MTIYHEVIFLFISLMQHLIYQGSFKDVHYSFVQYSKIGQCMVVEDNYPWRASKLQLCGLVIIQTGGMPVYL